jgi:hypothetical protein
MALHAAGNAACTTVTLGNWKVVANSRSRNGIDTIAVKTGLVFLFAHGV